MPFFKEFCVENGLHPDWVKNRAKLNKKVARELDMLDIDRENLLQRGALNKTLDKTFCMFALKQMGWRESVEVEKKTTIDFNGDMDKWAK